MTQVNFYTLLSSAIGARLQFVCRLTEKAYSLGHKIHIHTDSQQQTKLLDDLLWQYSTTSFIPHRNSDSGPDNDEGVSMGTELLAGQQGDVLINLATQACQADAQFSRINEVIIADEKSLIQGRSRYRFYQEKGYQVETFKI